MSHVPNELSDEFPDEQDRIHELKTTNEAFSRLVDDFHELNRTIHRVETRIEPASDETEEEMKRKRLALLDTIAEALKSAA